MRRERREPVEVPPERRGRAVIVQRRAHLVGIQRRLLVVAEECDRIDEAAVRVERNVAQEVLALNAVREQRPDRGGQLTAAGHPQPVEPRHARMRQIPVVAAEQLVAAIPRQHNSDVAPGDLGHVPRRNR